MFLREPTGPPVGKHLPPPFQSCSCVVLLKRVVVGFAWGGQLASLPLSLVSCPARERIAPLAAEEGLLWENVLRNIEMKDTVFIPGIYSCVPGPQLP